MSGWGCKAEPLSPEFRRCDGEFASSSITDCKDLKCPFLGEVDNQGTPIIGGHCMVFPEECPRRGNTIDLVAVLETLEGRANSVVQRADALKILIAKVRRLRHDS